MDEDDISEAVWDSVIIDEGSGGLNGVAVPLDRNAGLTLVLWRRSDWTRQAYELYGMNDRGQFTYRLMEERFLPSLTGLP